MASASWTGVKQLGTPGCLTTATSVTVGTDNCVYIAGSTNGGLDGNTLSGEGSRDFFLTKYDSIGNRLFTKQLGSPGNTALANSAVLDAYGNVYVAGQTEGGLDGNTLSGVGSTDFFITKYDSSGNRLYTKQLGVSGCTTIAKSLAADKNGNVYVGGYTNGGLDGNSLSGNGSTDFFLTKYDSIGNRLFTNQIGVSGRTTFAESVATDNGGNLYIAGYTYGGLDGNTLSSEYSPDLFVTKYDSNGVKQYTRQLGTPGQFTMASGVVTDAFGNVYVAGTTNGGLDGNAMSGIWELFLTKYDGSGVKQYTKQLGTPGQFVRTSSVATDATGNVYVAGITTGGLDGNTLSGYGSIDTFLTKYDSSGVKQYTRQLGASGKLTEASDVATDSTGNVYITGHTEGGLAGNTLTGTFDFFVAKYSGNGIQQ